MIKIMRRIFPTLLMLVSTLSFGQKTENESIYVHTDKEIYFPGEILWFKVYAVVGTDLLPVNGPSVAYLELTDRQGTQVLQHKIETGQASTNGGSVFIPQRLGSGTYTLTGATLASEAAGRSFSKTITVLNPFAITHDTLAVSPKSGYSVRWFPEGGTFVQGIRTRVGFKVSDANGKGVRATLTLPDGTRTVSNAFGIGSFGVTPDVATSDVSTHVPKMKIKVTLPDGKELEQALPPAAKTGYVLNAEDQGTGYAVRVSSVPARAGENLILIAESIGGQFFTLGVALNTAGTAEYLLPRSRLPEGTSRLTLLGSDHTPLAERIVFRNPEKALDLRLSSAKKDFSPREEVVLSLNQTPAGPATTADLSISVKKLDDIQRPSEENIRSYFYLRKDLTGEIENPDAYFSGNPGADLDNLLLTHGWRRFKKPDSTSEGRYHRVRIRFTDKTSNQAISGREAMLSIPSKSPLLYTAVTDTGGVATFWVRNLYGTQNLAATLTSGEPSHAELIRFQAETTPPTLPDIRGISQESYNEYAINVQVENIYSGKNRTSYLLPSSLDSIPFFGKAEVRYRLDDYTRFVIMEEVMREYVKEVNVRKSRGNFHFRTLDAARGVHFNDDPLILLDGVPVSNADRIMAYDPLKVEYIDVVTSRFFLGKKRYEGIVSYRTYKGLLEDYTLDPAFSVFTYEGLQPEREFYSPDIPGKAAVPDNRTVLYWNPRVVLKGDESTRITFPTSDLPGEYEVDIQGIDSKGSPGSTRLRFTVKQEE